MSISINNLICCQAGKDTEVRKEEKRHERRRKEGNEDAEGVLCLATSILGAACPVDFGDCFSM